MSNLDLIRGRQVVVPLTNKTGGQVVEGDVVIVDEANAGAFDLTTIESDTLILGVVAETIANDAEGRVLIAGYAPVVNVDGATAIGDFLVTSTTSKKASPKPSITTATFGVALSSTAGVGTIEAILWVGQGGPVGPTGDTGDTGPTGPAPAGQLVLTARGGSPRSTSGCADAAKIPGLGTNAIDIIALAFDTTTQEYAQWAEIVMPSDWDGGTVIAKFYWTCATGVGIADAGVRWSIKGGSWADDEALDAALGTAQEVTDIWIADEDLHVSSETPALTLAGTPAANEHVLFEVSRNVAHADDTLAGDALLIAVLISYTRV